MNFVSSIILPIAVAIFASTGFWSWLSNRKASNKDLSDKLDRLSAKLDDVEYKVDQSEAIACRARLLAFNKELIEKQRHTFEEFGQVLEDCDRYEKFCNDHPDFKNKKAKLSIENILRCYQKCEDEGDFL